MSTHDEFDKFLDEQVQQELEPLRPALKPVSRWLKSSLPNYYETYFQRWLSLGCPKTIEEERTARDAGHQ